MTQASLTVNRRRSALQTLTHVRAELGPLSRLAWPVVLAELSWMGMALVDTMMVGRLSPEAVGGVSIGGGVFFVAAIFGMGVLFGLDFAVAHAFGAGRHDDVHAWLVSGVYASGLLAVVLTFAIRAVLPLLPIVGVRPEVATQAIIYGEILAWSLLPLFLFTALRRYLQATNLVKPVMFALVSANVMNALADWVLVFGHWGLPALGVAGAAWATMVSRLYLLLYLIAYIGWREARQSTGLLRASLRADVARLRKLFALGLPAALQLVFEVGVFVVVTTLVGTLDAISLAAHHIALSAASVTFMIPLGISSAAAVRVGQAVGRRDARQAQASGWAAILLGAAAMALGGLVFVVVPEPIVQVFTNDAATIAVGASLLAIAAVFQLFDGIQVACTGALRGLGDTRTPMLTNLFGHWVVGLPIGYYLTFHAGFGVVGVWVGLCVGLVIVAVVLLTAWSRASRPPSISR